MMNIFVDIDGILTVETEGHDYTFRTPRVDVICKLQSLSRHHNITLFSSRYSEDMDVTIEWLTEHHVPYNNILLGKPKYDVLIDDKAYNSLDEFLLRCQGILGL